MVRRAKKTNKQKSFFFSDYQESEIAFIKKDANKIKISLNRVVFLFFIFLSLAIIFSTKVIYLSFYPQQNLFSERPNLNYSKERADITDRKGTLIARNIYIYSAGIKPKLVKDKKNLVINLKIIFPDIDIDEIEKRLAKDKFFYIKKRLTEDEKTKLWLLGNKAIAFEKKQHRIYPQKNLFSHILGQTDDNNTGISGIEKYFDNNLKNRKFVDSNLALTLDANLQYLIREELINAYSDFNNIGAAAILMDVNNGEILSLVSLPDYDLNQRISIKDEAYSNKITLGVYELGSVFKTFTIAAGLENEIISSDTIFKNYFS